MKKRKDRTKIEKWENGLGIAGVIMIASTIFKIKTLEVRVLAGIGTLCIIISFVLGIIIWVKKKKRK